MCVPRKGDRPEHTSLLCSEDQRHFICDTRSYFWQWHVVKDILFRCLEIKTDSELTRLMNVIRLRNTNPARNMSSSMIDSQWSKMNKHKCFLSIVDGCLSHLSKREKVFVGTCLPFAIHTSMHVYVVSRQSSRSVFPSLQHGRRSSSNVDNLARGYLIIAWRSAIDVLNIQKHYVCPYEGASVEQSVPLLVPANKQKTSDRWKPTSLPRWESTHRFRKKLVRGYEWDDSSNPWWRPRDFYGKTSFQIEVPSSK